MLIWMIPVLTQAQDGGLEKYIDSLLWAGSSSNMPASYILVARDGKALVKKAYGMADLALGTHAQPDQRFALASVSKQMIAVAILQLAEQGKLKLTDNVEKFIPSFNSRGKVVTIEHLLTHTSGIYSETGATGATGKTLFDLTIDKGLLSEQQFLNYVNEHAFYFEPGADWGWNGYAYYIAFFIVEKASGMKFHEYMQTHLFDPAGMTNTFSKVAANRLGGNNIPNFVSSYYFPDADGKWMSSDFAKLNAFFFYPRYAIVSSLEDLMKWDVALRNGTLLPKMLLDKAWTPYKLNDGRSTQYGLGWAVAEYKGVKILAHVGIGTNPICTVHVPEYKLFLVYTQFYGNYEQCEIILKKILSRLLSWPYPKPEMTAKPLADYTGIYKVHRMGLRLSSQLSDGPVYLKVTASGDTLFIQQTAGEKLPLRAAGDDRFLPSRSENTWYIFNRGTSGQVTSVTQRGTFWTFGPDVGNEKQSIQLPTPPRQQDIPLNLLKKYSGIYYNSSLDNYRFIETDGNRMHVKMQGRSQELIPVSHTEFVLKGAEDVNFRFVEDRKGEITLTIFGLRKVSYHKVE
jgi:D-alanyl-D-alanine carboxypeptidase